MKDAGESVGAAGSHIDAACSRNGVAERVVGDVLEQELGVDVVVVDVLDLDDGSGDL